MQASKKGQLRHWNFQKNHPIWVRTDKEIHFCGDLSVVLTALIAIRKLHQPHVPTGKQANMKILFAPSHFDAASVAKNMHDSKHPSRVLRWLELRSCLVESSNCKVALLLSLGTSSGGTSLWRCLKSTCFSFRVFDIFRVLCSGKDLAGRTHSVVPVVGCYFWLRKSCDCPESRRSIGFTTSK